MDERPGRAKRPNCAIISVLACYVLTTVVPIVGVLAGYSFVKPGSSIPYGQTEPMLRFAAWDGGQYSGIVDHGYSYDPDKMSNVAFYPAYPLIAKGVARLTGLSSVAALLLVAHISLALCFVLLWKYVRLRFVEYPETAAWSLLAFGLFPTTFFFRMAYSESLFILLCLAILYGVERHWPIVVVALIAGVCTATRAVGIATLPIVLLYVLRRDLPWSRRFTDAVIAVPLNLLGLVAYMGYLWHAFDAPLAFAQAQENYTLRPDLGLVDKIPRLLAGEPLWGNYLVTSDAYWQKFSPSPSPWFNLQFANPIYVIVSAAALAIGWSKGLLTRYEICLALALIAIPYLTRAYPFCMGSQGRYVAAAVPVYLVWGHCLSRLPILLSGSILGVWSFFLGIYAALFAAWYFFV